MEVRLFDLDLNHPALSLSSSSSFSEKKVH